MDPRIHQIGALASLWIYGVGGLGFDTDVRDLAATVGAAWAVQAWFAWRAGVRFDPRSPLVSSLSIVLLMRATSPWILAAAGAGAMAAKHWLRVDGKHVWNPSALAIVAAVSCTDAAWIAPGQWGRAAWFAFAVACAGGWVVFRALRSDVSAAFAAAFAGIVLARSAWLGDPLAVPLHRLEDGALLVFTFFMISDPKTTPDSRAGRMAFASMVAGLAAVLRFGLHVQAAPIFALVACAPLVPLFDRWLPGARYAWPGGAAVPSPDRGDLHATQPALRPARRGPGWARA